MIWVGRGPRYNLIPTSLPWAGMPPTRPSCSVLVICHCFLCLSPPRSSWAASGRSREAMGPWGQMAVMQGQGGRHSTEASSFCPGTTLGNSSRDFSADRVIQHTDHNQQSLRGEISQGTMMGLPSSHRKETYPSGTGRSVAVAWKSFSVRGINSLIT